MKVKSTNTTKPKITRSKPKKNLLLIGLFVIAFTVVSLLSWFALSAVFNTETYYVLNTEASARQLITVEMLTAQETSQGTAPRNAISMDEVQRGGVYAKYPLYAGDVLSASNAGSLDLTSLGIPDEWSITSFTVSSEDAIGGALMRGDYIDILGVNEEGARYIFNNVLILDVSYSSEEITSETSSRIGELIQYTIGMPAEDAAMLHSAVYLYEVIKVVKAPSSVQYAGRNVDSLGRTFKFGNTTLNVDLFEGTDSTFTPVVRDERGLPVNENNCAAGTIEPSSLCAELNFPFDTQNNSNTDTPATPDTDNTQDTDNTEDTQNTENAETPQN